MAWLIQQVKSCPSRKGFYFGDSGRSACVRLGLLVLTNFLVSMTVCILAMLSLTKVYIPAVGEAVLALVLFPLNACLNPIINTLTLGQYIKAFIHK